jgi:ABC-2 type transport system ATP-binding protein
MESVEELCTHIALINKSKVILNGSIREIRNMYRTNAYRISYTGDSAHMNKSLEGLGSVAEEEVHDGVASAVVTLQPDVDTNKLLSSLLPVVTVHGLTEVLPGVSDIFISKVSESSMQTPTTV